MTSAFSAFADSECPDQFAYPRSLIRAFAASLQNNLISQYISMSNIGLCSFTGYSIFSLFENARRTFFSSL